MNLKNRPTFAEVTVKIKVAQFFVTHSVDDNVVFLFFMLQWKESLISLVLKLPTAVEMWANTCCRLLMQAPYLHQENSVHFPQESTNDFPAWKLISSTVVASIVACSLIS